MQNIELYIGTIAGINIIWKFLFPDTKHYLRKYITDSSYKTKDISVSVSEQEFSDWKHAGNSIDAFAEFCLLCQQTSEHLLMHDRCIFHAVAISCFDRAWLIAAGSGVGKSTLCRNLTDTYPNEIQVINGDKPALECRPSQGIMVHPSPWTGKEGWHGAEKAPLAGIFLLQRSEETAVRPALEREAVRYIYLSIFQSFMDEKVIRAAGTMTENMIKSVPVWLLTSKDVRESAKLVYKTMQEESNREL